MGGEESVILTDREACFRMGSGLHVSRVEYSGNEGGPGSTLYHRVLKLCCWGIDA